MSEPKTTTATPHDFVDRQRTYHTGIYHELAEYDLIYCRRCGYVVQDRYRSTDAPSSCIALPETLPSQKTIKLAEDTDVNPAH